MVRGCSLHPGPRHFIFALLEAFSSELLVETVNIPSIAGVAAVVEPVRPIRVVPLLVRFIPVAPMAIVVTPMVADGRLVLLLPWSVPSWSTSHMLVPR